MIAIVSPHLDDAIFSLGDYIQGKDVWVITPFAGTPTDEKGRTKYEQLHKEHPKACEIVGANYTNGYFLDDVYPGLNEDDLKDWLEDEISGFDLVLVPLGIHHPDHKATRRACDKISLPNRMYYSEHPYTVDYPELHEELTKKLKQTYAQPPTLVKEAAVRAYTSQTNDDVVARCMQIERLWT